MKSIIIKSKTKKAFTIVELLTVMSIIVILIGLLVPALNQVKQYAYEVRQRAQLHSIDTAIESFNNVMDGYPDSSQSSDNTYCGAMKLAEAMMGQDLLGFHPDSIFRVDGTDGHNRRLYDANNINNISARKDLFLPLDNANAFKLKDIYPNTGTLFGERFVLSDVCRRVTNINGVGKIGMPILYYRADTAKTMHNINNPNDPENIYNYRDNQILVGLGMPFSSGQHRLYADNGKRFYLNTKSNKVTAASVPARADSYILISAGNDGEYGTEDDICNFDWKYQE